MAFTGNYMCTSFKVALLNGEMDFSSDTSQSFKIALYTSDATLDATTTVYSTTNEASGTGYTAGGNTLTIATNPTSDTATSGTVAYLDFSDYVMGKFFNYSAWGANIQIWWYNSRSCSTRFWFRENVK